MKTKAYVLIETTGLKTEEVAKNLKQLEGIKSVNAVTPPYDFIATVEGENLNHVRDLVTSRIKHIPNICRTNTCVCLDQSFRPP